MQPSLRHGVPLVVAGATQDKPEVAARVAWSGAGVDLRTGTRRRERVLAAVRRVLAGDGYRTAADRIADEMAALGDPIDTIADRLEALVAERSSV